MHSPPRSDRPHYEVDVRPLRDELSLAAEWQVIEAKARLPFFLTWAWVSTWLNTTGPDVLAVRVSSAGETVGIGLFTESRQIRHGVIASTQLRLLQVGDNLMDQVWVEYNNLICLPGHERWAIVEAIHALAQKHNRWDEIIVSMMPQSLANHVTEHVPGAFADGVHPCYAVDLDGLRTSGSDYLATLSSNTRYQIRNAKRRYERKYGPLHIERADDTETALGFFREAGPLHLDRWDDSGYNNSSFVRFHESLIAQHLGNGVELLRVRSGTQTVGIMYYHIVGSRVYFYLHGLTFDDDPKLKPGLVVHSLACQYFLEQDKSLYDFMGGYSRYKLQLADKTEALVTVCVQRPRLRFRLEAWARAVKQRLFPSKRQL